MVDLIANKKYVNDKHLLTYSKLDLIEHAVLVGNLAYEVGKEMGLDEESCLELYEGGLFHDIGKEEAKEELYEITQNPLMVEEIKYVRMHAEKGSRLLKKRGYSDKIAEMVKYHHENWDGTGYPDNLRGEDIPLGARILRVCDVFSALVSDRPYRKKFDKETAIEMMIEEVRHFDMAVFLAFQRLVHRVCLDDLMTPK